MLEFTFQLKKYFLSCLDTRHSKSISPFSHPINFHSLIFFIIIYNNNVRRGKGKKKTLWRLIQMKHISYPKAITSLASLMWRVLWMFCIYTRGKIMCWYACYIKKTYQMILFDKWNKNFRGCEWFKWFFQSKCDIILHSS